MLSRKSGVSSVVGTPRLLYEGRALGEDLGHGWYKDDVGKCREEAGREEDPSVGIPDVDNRGRGRSKSDPSWLPLVPSLDFLSPPTPTHD